MDKKQKIENEYNRIKDLFSEIDDKQKSLLDGAFRETARLRVELDELDEIKNKTGLVKVHPEKPDLQKELPVAKALAKTRPSYINYLAKLSNILGKNIIDDEDSDLEDFE
nr:MAG TPA: hypothetical protein [Caudoviricetes sp.]